MVNKVVLADRVLARYAASTRMAGSYQIPFAALAAAVDNWDPLAKDNGPTTKALDLLDKIEQMVKDDQDFLTSDKATGGNALNAKAPQQRIDNLREELHAAQRAAKNVGESYDAMNESFLRLGLK